MKTPALAKMQAEMRWGALEQVNRGWRFFVGDVAGARKFVIELVKQSDAWDRYWAMVPLAHALWSADRGDEIALNVSRWCHAAKGQALVAPEVAGLKSAATELGRLGGLKGGHARAAALSADERSSIAKKAADARWGNQDAPAAPQEVSTPEPDPEPQKEEAAVPDAPPSPLGSFTERELLEIAVENIRTGVEFDYSNEDRLKRLERNVAAYMLSKGHEYDWERR